MGNSLGSSLRWSTAGEALAKLVTPITNMILARVLMPEDFGIVATVNMIITFVDLFTDSGFAKYIIQSDFDSEEQLDDYINVAFWTNLMLSIMLWLAICIFRYPIANIVGSKGYEIVIVIASTQLIITSFSSIQTAIFRRNFAFKILFVARVVTSAVPLCITVPLAFIFKNYWALVVGALVQQFFNALFLTIKSKWKPKLFYRISILRKMLSYSIWSLAEALAYWLTTWFDVFIIGATFSVYLLGLYKNSLNMVNSVMQLVKASIIPVLFASLSRLKNDNEKFFKVYLGLQESASFFLIPIGIGLFVFSDFATLILFGSKWSEASSIVGAWALSLCFTAAFVNFYGEAIKAVGRPRLLFIYEVGCLLLMIPICIYAKSFGFWAFVYTRTAVCLIQIIIGLIIMKAELSFSIIRMILNIAPSVFCAMIMGVAGQLLRTASGSIIWQFASICICALIYIGLYYLLFGKRLKGILDVLKIKTT